MKKILVITLTCLAALSMVSCNQQVWDFEYTFNYANCYMDWDEDGEGEWKMIPVTKWCDYEGEQLQIISDDKTYVFHSSNCVLIKD